MYTHTYAGRYVLQKGAWSRNVDRCAKEQLISARNPATNSRKKPVRLTKNDHPAYVLPAARVIRQSMVEKIHSALHCILRISGLAINIHSSLLQKESFLRTQLQLLKSFS